MSCDIKFDPEYKADDGYLVLEMLPEALDAIEAECEDGLAAGEESALPVFFSHWDSGTAVKIGTKIFQTKQLLSSNLLYLAPALPTAEEFSVISRYDSILELTPDSLPLDYFEYIFRNCQYPLQDQTELHTVQSLHRALPLAPDQLFGLLVDTVAFINYKSIHTLFPIAKTGVAHICNCLNEGLDVAPAVDPVALRDLLQHAMRDVDRHVSDAIILYTLDFSRDDRIEYLKATASATSGSGDMFAEWVAASPSRRRVGANVAFIHRVVVEDRFESGMRIYSQRDVALADRQKAPCIGFDDFMILCNGRLREFWDGPGAVNKTYNSQAVADTVPGWLRMDSLADVGRYAVEHAGKVYSVQQLSDRASARRGERGAALPLDATERVEFLLSLEEKPHWTAAEMDPIVSTVTPPGVTVEDIVVAVARPMHGVSKGGNDVYCRR